MLTINIHKATTSCGDEVRSIQIIADKEIPEIINADSLIVLKGIYESDAEALYQAFESLPGGTLDVLLRKLLEHKASLLRVRW